MRIVRHDQCVTGFEDAVIRNLEHSVAATHERHRLQVVAQGGLLVGLTALAAISSHQRAVQAGELFALLHTEEFFLCGNRARGGDTGCRHGGWRVVLAVYAGHVP